MGERQFRFERVQKISAPPGFDPLDRPFRKESLYRLSCPDPPFEENACVKEFVLFLLIISGNRTLVTAASDHQYHRNKIKQDLTSFYV